MNEIDWRAWRWQLFERVLRTLVVIELGTLATLIVGGLVKGLI